MRARCMDEFVLSVLELNTYVGDRLSQDPFLNEIWVRGEICDLSFRHHTAYFALADEQASVDCMLFGCDVSDYAGLLEEGRTVLLNGDISLYRKNGRFRVVVHHIRTVGLGELLAKLNLLKEKLDKQGVFALERKKKIAAYPRKIGIVTSKDGAAIQDIINICGRRNPSVRLVLYPAKVQGADAPVEIARGIAYFNAHTDVDTLIVGRGGGSAEDLFAFNDERVVMAVYQSAIPVISAVGHESDFTLTDLAADLRAPTPSAAAELAVPQQEDILAAIRTEKEAMRESLNRRLYETAAKLAFARGALTERGIAAKMQGAKEILSAYRRQADRKVHSLYLQTVSNYHAYRAALEAGNPARAFERGFSIVLKEGKSVKAAEELKRGDRVTLVFADGSQTAEIQ